MNQIGQAEQSFEYHIQKRSGPQPWQVTVTYGLCDTKTVGSFISRKEAAEKAKEHAAKHGWKAIVIY